MIDITAADRYRAQEAMKAADDCLQTPTYAFRSGPAPVGRYVKRFAIGDPQAPLRTIFTILAAHGCLNSGGFLRSDVQLLSMGDHFDYRSEDTLRAARDGSCFLAWLAAHWPDQVTILLGNHDIARVGEFLSTSDGIYGEVRQRWDRRPSVDEQADAAWIREQVSLHNSWPPILAAVQYRSFERAQTHLMKRLLIDNRFQLASVETVVDGDGNANRVLATHAGVTKRECALLGHDQGDPTQIADLLNSALRAAVDRVRYAWGHNAYQELDLEPLYYRWQSTRANAGLLIHRPDGRAECQGDESTPLDPLPAPRVVPPSAFAIGCGQLVGHTTHDKLRQWIELENPSGDPDADARRIRHLLTRAMRYRIGLPSAAMWDEAMIFTDGAMASTVPEVYELLSLAPT